MKPIITLICFFTAACAHAQTYAITADRLIDGKSDKAIDNPVVIVYKNKVVDINFNGKIPDSATVISLKGYTILPGMMDVHTHMLADGGDYNKDLYENSPALRALRAVKNINGALQNGFTTLRDVCSGFEKGH
jgi:imidazolonepropionase-like amidohydrolase